MYFVEFKTRPLSASSVLFKQFSIGNPVLDKMVDPKRVVSYEDMLKVIHQPEKVIIDVRNPDEVNETGKIPSSINIPCNKFVKLFENDFRLIMLRF